MLWMSIRHEQGGESYLLQCGKEGHFKAQCPEPRKVQRAQNAELSYGENDKYIRVVREEMCREESTE